MSHIFHPSPWNHQGITSFLPLSWSTVMLWTPRQYNSRSLTEYAAHAPSYKVYTHMFLWVVVIQLYSDTSPHLIETGHVVFQSSSVCTGVMSESTIIIVIHYLLFAHSYPHSPQALSHLICFLPAEIHHRASNVLWPFSPACAHSKCHLSGLTSEILKWPWHLWNCFSLCCL